MFVQARPKAAIIKIFFMLFVLSVIAKVKLFYLIVSIQKVCQGSLIFFAVFKNAHVLQCPSALIRCIVEMISDYSVSHNILDC